MRKTATALLAASLGLSLGCSSRIATTSPTTTAVADTDAKGGASTFWLSLPHSRWTTGLTVAWPFTNDATGNLTATFGVAWDSELSYMFTASPTRAPKGAYTATVRLVGSGTLMPGDGIPMTPNARLFVFCYSNSWDVNKPDARWWSNPVAFPLVASDWTTITASLSDPSQWSDVNGQRGSDIPVQFAAAMQNVSSLGVTFGGEFFGHGAYGSTQQFQVQRIGVQ